MIKIKASIQNEITEQVASKGRKTISEGGLPERLKQKCDEVIELCMKVEGKAEESQGRLHNLVKDQVSTEVKNELAKTYRDVLQEEANKVLGGKYY